MERLQGFWSTQFATRHNIEKTPMKLRSVDLAVSGVGAQLTYKTGLTKIRIGDFESSGNSKSNLLCTHCQKKGHVESTCWTKYPHLKDKSKSTATGEARVAFHATTKTARKVQSGGNDEYSNPKHWILDSGASEHFTPYRHVLIDYKTLDEPVEVNTAKGKLFG